MTLGINHQSPLIHFFRRLHEEHAAGNQSPIPFDTLAGEIGYSRWKLGINHQSPLIHFYLAHLVADMAGNQSPIPFDTLVNNGTVELRGWESITNPL